MFSAPLLKSIMNPYSFTGQEKVVVKNSARTRRLGAQDIGEFRSLAVLVLGKIWGLGDMNREAFYQGVIPCCPWGFRGPGIKTRENR